MQTWQKALAVFGVLMLVGGGCSSADPVPVPEVVAPAELPANFVSYSDEANGWSVGYPSDWSPIQNPDDAGQTFFATPYVESADEFEHSVSVTVTPNTAPVPAAQMAEELKGFLMQLGASSIVESGAIDIPQGEAAKISYTIEDPDGGETLYGTQVGVFKGNTLYVMTFTATEVGREAFLLDFEDMYTSFRAE